MLLRAKHSCVFCCASHSISSVVVLYGLGLFGVAVVIFKFGFTYALNFPAFVCINIMLCATLRAFNKPSGFHFYFLHNYYSVVGSRITRQNQLDSASLRLCFAGYV